MDGDAADEIWTDPTSSLKIREKTTYTMVQYGQLPGFKVGEQWRSKRYDIDVWIEQRKHHMARKTR